MKFIFVIVALLMFSPVTEAQFNPSREAKLREARQKAKAKEKSRKQAKENKEKQNIRSGEIYYVNEDVSHAFFSKKLAIRYSEADKDIWSSTPVASSSARFGASGNTRELREEVVKEAGAKVVEYKKGDTVKVKAVKDNLVIVTKGKKELYMVASDLLSEEEWNNLPELQRMKSRSGEGWTNGLPDHWIFLDTGDDITIIGNMYGFSDYITASTYGSLLAKAPQKAQQYVEGLIERQKATKLNEGSVYIVEELYNDFDRVDPKRTARCVELGGDKTLYISECEYSINTQIQKSSPKKNHR